MTGILTFAVHAAAWLLTYLAHSTVLFGGTLLAIHFARPSARVADALAKAAVVAALLTTTLATAVDLQPLTGRLAVPPAIREIRVFSEIHTTRADDGVARPAVHREARVIDPGFPQPAHVAALAVLLWAVVAGGRLYRHRHRRRALDRELRDRRALDDRHLAAWVTGIRPGLQVSVSDRIPGPAALSAREICVPGRLLRELGSAEQQGVLAHEAAHVVRRDPAWLALLAALDAALFFQPLHRRVLRSYRRSAEILCDDFAVAATGRPIALARSITRVAGWMRDARPLPVPAMAEGGVPFLERIERLVHTQPERRGRSAVLAVTLLLPLVLFAVPAAGAGDHPAFGALDDLTRALPGLGNLPDGRMEMHVVRRVSGQGTADTVALDEWLSRP